MHEFSRTYLLIGHVTKDLLPDGGFLAGGTVTYAAKVAKRFEWAPVVVTAAAPDFVRPTGPDNFGLRSGADKPLK